MSDEKLRCPCNNCSFELEFEPPQIGETVACPRCQMDTRLYWMGPPKTETLSADGPMERVKWTQFVPHACILAAFVFLAFVWVRYSEQIAKLAASFELDAKGAVVVVFLALLAILWFIFPFFVWWYLRRLREEMIKSNDHLDRVCTLLKRIDVSIRNVNAGTGGKR